MDADARPERAPSQTLGAKTVAATPVHPPGDDRTHRPAGSDFTSRSKPLGSTSSTKASSGYEPSRSPGRNQTTRPNDHRTTPDHLEPAPTRDDTRATVTPQ